MRDDIIVALAVASILIPLGLVGLVLEPQGLTNGPRAIFILVIGNVLAIYAIIATMVKKDVK